MKITILKIDQHTIYDDYYNNVYMVLNSFTEWDEVTEEEYKEALDLVREINKTNSYIQYMVVAQEDLSEFRLAAKERIQELRKAKESKRLADEAFQAKMKEEKRKKEIANAAATLRKKEAKLRKAQEELEATRKLLNQ